MKTRLALLAVLLLAGCEERFTSLAPDAGISALTPIQVQPEPQAARPAPSFEEPSGTDYFAERADGKLHVWFLDIGHGDAVLIRAPSGRTVLIDGGPEEAASRLMRRLPELLGGPLDMAIITHPDPHHFGALGRALQVVGVKRVLAPRPTAQDPAEYRQLVSFFEQRGLPFFSPEAPGDGSSEPLTIALGDGATLSIYWPRTPVESRLAVDNAVDANSMVMRLSWKNTSLLLTADATADTEKYLLSKRWPFRSTLLKVSAHGDAAASSEAFLAAVKPEAAIISVGAGNQQGAPARQTLTRLQAAGADVYRTDLDGEIRADSDGEAFVLVTERPAAGEEPDTPHLYGSGKDAHADFARAVVADARRSRSKVVTLDANAPLEEQYGKIIEVKPDRRGSSSASEEGGSFVGSRNSNVFHLSTCRNARRIQKKNLVVFQSRAEASRGRRPAGDCNP